MGRAGRLLAALIALPLIAAACGGGVAGGSAPASGTDACAGQPDQKKVTLMGDWLPWASQGPFFEARAKGFYAAEGLTVDIISPASSADPIRIVALGQVDVALSYVPEVMISRDKGIPVVALGATLRVLSSGLMFLPDSPVNSPADLKGKTLGVPVKLDQQAYLASVLEAGHLTKSDVKVVDPGFGPVPLLLTHKVDGSAGLTMFEGIDADAALGGGKHVKWLLYKDYGVPAFYYQLMVTNENWPRNHPATACRFLRATLKGLKAWLSTPSSLTEIATANNQVSGQMHQQIYDATKAQWTAPDGKLLTQDASVWQAARDWALQKGLITAKIDFHQYFTNDYYPPGTP